MLEFRAPDQIHHEQGGWFDARWHFSFGSYRHPHYMGLGPLRVFNDDRLVPGAVWPMHPHADVEGMTYVVEGLFGHEDDQGGPPGPLRPGAVQRMTLGRGAFHSERNASPDKPMRFLQFWILPDTAGLTPQVEQQQFDAEHRTDRLLQVVAPVGRAGELGVVGVHQDAAVYVCRLTGGSGVAHTVGPARSAYLYVIDGTATVAGQVVTAGGAVVVVGPEPLDVRADEAGSPCELILVEVPSQYEPVGVWARRGERRAESQEGRRAGQ